MPESLDPILAGVDPGDSVLAERYGIEPGERVEAIVGAEAGEEAHTIRSTFLIVFLPILTTSMAGLVTGDPVSPVVLAVAAFAGLLVGGLAAGFTAIVSARSGPVLLATDRGIRLRRSDEPVLVPWDDIITLEQPFPLYAQYVMELRDGAADPGLRRTLWDRIRPGRGVGSRRIVGDLSVWDVGGRKLEEVQDALDRHAVRSLESELRASELPTLPTASPTTPTGEDPAR